MKPHLEPAPSNHPLSQELTARGLVVGCVIGAMLTLANVLMSLKTGIWDGGFPLGAVLAFTLIAPLARHGTPTSASEILVAQAAAAAAGAMPATAGLLGAMPALELMDQKPPYWGIVGWGLALGALGLIFGVVLRHRLLDEERLPFPSGRATAQIIATMRASGDEALRRAKRVVGSACASMAFVWLRDAPPAWIPATTFVPASIMGIPAASLTLGVSWSPLMLGVGGLIGPRIGLSMLLGVLIAWAGLAPIAVRTGEASADFGSLVPWLTWPGLGLMITPGLTGLFGMVRSLGGEGGWRGVLGRAPVPATAAERISGNVAARKSVISIGAVAIVSTIAIVVIGRLAFGASPLVIAVALALAIPLAAVSGRVAGQTDFNPLGPLGQLTQLVLAVLTRGAPAMNAVGGQVVAGSLAPSATLIYMVRAGRDLGVSFRAVLVACIAGAAVGALVCVPAYVIVTHAYGLGSTALPVPSARTWKVLAEAVTGDAGIPAHAVPIVWIASIAGFALSLGERRLRMMPSPAAMGAGFILPAFYSVTIALGAGAFAMLARRRMGSAEEDGVAIASGAVTGEALIGILIALLLTTGVLAGPR